MGAWGSPGGALSPACHRQGHLCSHPCRGRRASPRKSGQMSTVARWLLSSEPPVLFFWSASLSPLAPAALHVPSLSPRGQSLTYYFMYLFKALQSPWPERHLVVTSPPHLIVRLARDICFHGFQGASLGASLNHPLVPALPSTGSSSQHRADTRSPPSLPFHRRWGWCGWSMAQPPLPLPPAWAEAC